MATQLKIQDLGPAMTDALEKVRRGEEITITDHDPFDRLLLAQAAVESLSIVTSDREFQQYGVPVIW